MKPVVHQWSPETRPLVESILVKGGTIIIYGKGQFNVYCLKYLTKVELHALDLPWR